MANLTPESVISYDVSAAFLDWLNQKVLAHDPYKVVEAFFITKPKHPTESRRAGLFLRFDTDKRLSDDAASDVLFYVLAFVGVEIDDLYMDDVILSVDEDLKGKAVVQIGMPIEMAQNHFGLPKEFCLPN